MTRSPRRAAAGAVAALALTACTGVQSASAPAPEPTVGFTADSKVLLPAAPGEAAATVAPGQTGSRPDERIRSDADVAFVRDMVVHHRQALEMASLAQQHATDERVRRMADRIRAGQDPEIRSMQGWLEANGLATDEAHGGHEGHGDDHAGMPGMATAAQLAELAAARGAAFDRLFLDLMTAHHRGALTMVEEVTAGGRNPWVAQLAGDIAITQGVEIDRMTELRRGL